MAGYSQVKYIEGSRMCRGESPDIEDDSLEQAEEEIRRLKIQRSAAIGLCSTLLRGISMQVNQPALATTVLSAAKAEYDELIRTL